MQEFQVPWGQWYARTEKTLTFPDDWDVRFCGIRHYEALSAEQVSEKIDRPIGTDQLEALVSGKNSVCIVIDDISRPTPGAFLLPLIIQKLANVGIQYDQIKVLFALGGHRPMTKQEMELKVGKWVAERVQVLNHSPYATDLVTIENEG